MIAGTVASVFLCEEATDEYLVAQCQMPALARIAQLHDVVEEQRHEDMATILKVASEFVEAPQEAAPSPDLRSGQRSERSRRYEPQRSTSVAANSWTNSRGRSGRHR